MQESITYPDRDVIIITCYNRPDYLRLCLEYLARAEGIQNKNSDGWPDKTIWICIDRGRVLIREFYEVLCDFSNLNINIKCREPHSYSGNSYNTLESYKEACDSDFRFVYLMEDDVLVMPDFFKWHEEVQKQGDFMCSVGYRCSRNPAVTRDINDPSAYFISAQDYASIGVCWKREKLLPVIEHAKDEYYRSPKEYILKRFPNNRFSDCYTEQDGLIMRVMGETNGITAWSYCPRAYHIGFSGYHRLRSPRLSYNEIKEIIYDSEKVKQTDRDFHDIEVVPIESCPTQKFLHCVQRFD